VTCACHQSTAMIHDKNKQTADDDKN